MPTVTAFESTRVNIQITQQEANSLQSAPAGASVSVTGTITGANGVTLRQIVVTVEKV